MEFRKSFWHTSWDPIDTLLCQISCKSDQNCGNFGVPKKHLSTPRGGKNWNFKNLLVPFRDTPKIHIWAKFHANRTKTVACSVFTDWQTDRMTDTKIFYCKFLLPEVQNICKKILSLIRRKSTRNTLPHNMSFGTTDI